MPEWRKLKKTREFNNVKKHPIRPASEICSHRWSSDNVDKAYDFMHTNQTLSPGLVFPSIKIYKLSGNFFPWLQARKLKHGRAQPARIANLNVSSSHGFKFQPATSLKSCCWNQVAYHRTPLQTQSLGIKELPLQSSGGSLTHWWQTHELTRDLVYTCLWSIQTPTHGVGI